MKLTDAQVRALEVISKCGGRGASMSKETLLTQTGGCVVARVARDLRDMGLVKTIGWSWARLTNEGEQALAARRDLDAKGGG